MEVARRLINAALTGLCDNCGAQMEGYAEWVRYQRQSVVSVNTAKW
jgi:hypothetical protein